MPLFKDVILLVYPFVLLLNLRGRVNWSEEDIMHQEMLDTKSCYVDVWLPYPPLAWSHDVRLYISSLFGPQELLDSETMVS